MAYEKPKAVHFVALKDGVPLPRLHLPSLDARWYAAGLAEYHGVLNMLHITPAHRLALEEVCRQATEKTGYTIVCTRLEESC